MKEIKGSLKTKKQKKKTTEKESGRETRGRCGVSLKKKIYFEPFQKAGAADTQRPVQTESSCVSRTKCLGLPPTRSRGWEHVRFDTIQSDTRDQMKDPK